MRPSTDLMRSMLRSSPAAIVHRVLTSQGYEVSRDKLEELRALVVAEDGAPRVSQTAAPSGVTASSRVQYCVSESCDMLKRAIDKLYARVAAERGCSIEAAMLLMNYSPAQIARMAA